MYLTQGAFKLSIFKHKNTLLASWAALIMLAAMLIDPAVQLVFQFPSRLSVQTTASPEFKSSPLYDPTTIPFQGLMIRHNHITGERKFNNLSRYLAIC